jgi:hypothetical protein
MFKKILKTLALVTLGLFIPIALYAATPICNPYQGCTGSNTVPTLGQILEGNMTGVYTATTSPAVLIITATSTTASSTLPLLESTGIHTTVVQIGSELITNFTSYVKGIFSGLFTVNGLVKGNGSGTYSAATAGTDYAPATSGSSILKGNGSGGFSNTTAGTDYLAIVNKDTTLTGTGATGSALGVDLTHANTWTGTQTINNLISTNSTTTSATTTNFSATTGKITNATSTTLAITSLNSKILSTDASGNVVGTTTAQGTVTSVGVSSPNSTLTIGSSPVTNSGTITGDINLAHSNTWTGGQTFTNATSTTFAISGLNSKVLSTDAAGNIVGTSSSSVFVPTPGRGIYLTSTSTINTTEGCTYTVSTAAPQAGTNYTTIQAALNAANLNTGGTVCLEDANYTVSATLKIGTGVSLKGYTYGTYLNVDGNAVSPLIQASSTNITDVVIQDLIMNQTNAVASTTAVAIDASNMAFSVFSNIVIGDLTGQGFGYGVKINDTANHTFYDTFEKLRIVNGLQGIYASSTNPVNDNWFNNIRIANGSNGTGQNTPARQSYGVYLNNAQGNNFTNIDVEPNPNQASSSVGIYLKSQNVTGNAFHSVWIEGNATGTQIVGKSNDTPNLNTFVGGMISGNDATWGVGAPIDVATTSENTNVHDGGFNTTYLNTEVNYAIQNTPSPMTVIDNTNASESTIIENNQDYAAFNPIFIVKSLNSTDTSTTSVISNLGTGASLDVQGQAFQSANKGHCFQIKNAGANTYTYMYFKTGAVQVITATSCSGTGTTTTTWE